MNIEQLIYKSYKSTQSTIKKNNRFKQQLWDNLKCPNIKISKIETLKYNKKSLTNFFTRYNNCHNGDLTVFSKRQKKFISHFALRPRINSSSLSIKNSEHNYRDITFDSKISFGFGLEFEFILPFNKNKWAITIEPTYQNYKTNITTDSNSPNKGTITGISDYSSIEIPLSLRHYFFLKNDSKLFINTSFVLDYDLKSSLTIITTNISGVSNTPYSIKSRGNIAFGFGYKYNNKLGIELRYSMSRNILGNYVFYDSNYKTASLILGYSLF